MLHAPNGTQELISEESYEPHQTHNYEHYHQKNHQLKAHHWTNLKWEAFSQQKQSTY